MVGVAVLSLPQALAQQPMGTSEDTMDQQSYNTQRATTEYQIQKQECDTLKYNQPQSYDPCLQKAKSTRDNLRAQGSEQAGQGSQGFASNQSGQSGQKQGAIEKVTSVVKEKLVDWGLASPDQGQPSAGQQGQGSQQGSGQGRNPLQASFDGGQGMQGQGSGQQSSGAASGQGGQVGQQGLTQGQQFQGQQGQSGQGSFQGGNYGQQPQGQSGQQGTSGASQQFQSGGTQGTQGSSSQQAGSPGGEEEHMDSVKYYQEMARQQYGTLKQECNALKKDPAVYEQCQTYAKSIRDKITGMAEQNQRGG